jgi:uracil-DNA glycosylase family 4
MTDSVERDDLLALLTWWNDAGVSDALGDTPTDWTADGQTLPAASFVWPIAEAVDKGRQARPAPSAERHIAPGPGSSDRPPEARPPVARALSGAPPSVSPAARPAAAAPPSITERAARDAARTAPTLDSLEVALRQFEGCGLKTTAKNLCFYRGSPTARTLIIGEAPGREEDLEGRPFIGPAGQMLDRMLAAIGLGEADVHITNVVYWRPPGNRTPTPEEVLTCRPFLDRQIELVAPDLIVTLGGPATKAILQVEEGIMRVRGKWREASFGSRMIPVMPTLHPAYLLRTPAAKRQAWRDLLAIKAALAKPR